MYRRSSRHIIQGMQRDMSVSKFNPNFAYENMNIRITAREESTLLTITNEKGNALVEFSSDTIKGEYIGHSVLSNTLVLFTLDGYNTCIYKIQQEGIESGIVNPTKMEATLLFEGDLNMDLEHPLETLAIYENKNVQKIYWVDGKNQTRVINISNSYLNKPNDIFDFVRNVKQDHEVSIEKIPQSTGSFPSGTIQYVITYFNKYAQESNIFYTSSLNYTTQGERGGSPEEKSSDSFRITLENLDDTFEYVRIYSIIHSSKDTEVQVKKVADLNIQGQEVITYIDNNSKGEDVDPDLLMYIGGEPVIFNTLEQKDNTLFLGNYSLDRKAIPQELKDKIKKTPIGLFRREVKMGQSEKGEYPYKIQLDNPREDITYFKAREIYRLGLQFRHKSGRLSEPVYLGDYRMGSNPETSLWPSNNSGEEYSLFLPSFTASMAHADIVHDLKELGYTSVRGVVVFPSPQERSVIMQGVVVPTVFNVEDRYKNMPFAQPSWVARPVLNHSLKALKDDSYLKKYSYNFRGKVDPEVKNSIGAMLSNKAVKDPHTGEVYTDLLKEGTRLESGHYRSLLQSDDRGAEIQCNYGSPELPFVQESISEMEVLIFKQGKPHDYSEEEPWRTGDYVIAVESIDGKSLRVKPYNTYPTYKEFKKAYYDNFEYISGRIIGSSELGEFPTEEQMDLLGDLGGQLIFKSNQKGTTKSREDFVQHFKNSFYVDQNILNIFSPDITFNDNIHDYQNKDLNFRIVGFAYATSNISEYEILTATDKNSLNSIGLYTPRIRTLNRSIYGFRKNLSNIFYMDNKKGYMTYLWHREGSLNNAGIPTGSEDRKALLEKKSMSNITYCSHTHFFSNSVGSNIFDISKNSDNEYYKSGVTPLHIWDYQNEGIIRIPSPKNSDLGDLNYSGNISRVLVNPTKGPLSSGYPIVTSSRNAFDPDTVFNSDLKLEIEVPLTEASTKGKDPINISYKAGTHGVFALNYYKFGYTPIQLIMPTFDNSHFELNSHLETDEAINSYQNGIGYPFWSKNKNPLITRQGSIFDFKPEYSGYFIGEFYRDTDPNVIFGGKTEYALKNNLWLPSGDFKPLEQGTEVLYTEGDTYYQRYDHLVSYSTGKPTDKNNVVDILSFMVETRINIDGRYDRNRGQSNNLVMNPQIFNKMNSVYSQENNFFGYRILDKDSYELNDFPNSITWSKTKSFGEDVDTWTNINLSNTLDLDGDKGKLTSISKLNNELYAFQEKGISNILFNSRVQIPTEDGTPIEISNSNKVDGKRYLVQDVGCQNKFSLLPTKNGIYFIDNLGSELMLFNGENVQSLSDTHGFRTIFNKIKNIGSWNPKYFNNFIAHMDISNGDIYFTTKDFCLGYSELLQTFTSFYSYENVPSMFNLGGHFYSIKDGKIWAQNEGRYNEYFGEFKPYYIDIVTNKRSTEDKIFSNIEFRGDMFNEDNKLLQDCPFNHIKVSNEFQEGSEDLQNKVIIPSNLKQKFRMWRINMPRVNGTLIDRIRNPWIRLKLSNNFDRKHYNLVQIHDLKIYFYQERYY